MPDTNRASAARADDATNSSPEGREPTANATSSHARPPRTSRRRRAIRPHVNAENGGITINEKLSYAAVKRDHPAFIAAIRAVVGADATVNVDENGTGSDRVIFWLPDSTLRTIFTLVDKQLVYAGKTYTFKPPALTGRFKDLDLSLPSSGA